MKLKVKLVRGLAGKKKFQKDAVRSLGLRKINDERILEDNPMVRGNIEKVKHLIKVEEVE
ncbi:MAG: 50S ribosomal protein L30 [Hydrogenothermus sp.]|nr:MAG: 50S ribosomal protein L30 [Hydrogenothermus sp.]